MTNLESILACPACRGPLDRHSDEFECRDCHTRYPIEDGIVDLIQRAPNSPARQDNGAAKRSLPMTV